MDRRTRKKLREGVAAARAGRRAHARKLLWQVVEQDAGLEQAWWWLCQATDDPVEQRLALQNVLALNPDNPEAQARLIALRLHTLPKQTPPEPDPSDDLLAGVDFGADDSIDDPFQCAYCGEATGVDDRRCGHCRGKLFRRVAVTRNSASLSSLQLLLGSGLAIGILLLTAPLLALSYQQSRLDPAAANLMLSVPGVQPVLGNFIRMAPATIDMLLRALPVRAAVFVVLIIGLRLRWSLAYYGTMLGVVADVLGSLYLLVTGQLGWAGLLLNLVLTLGAGLLLFAVSYDFAVNHERMRVRPDTSARSSLDFYRRGHEYRRQGLWALAVAQWRKAVGLAPHQADYYRDLGIGYAQIRRYARSLRALREARRRSDEPEEIDKIIAHVEAELQRQRAAVT